VFSNFPPLPENRAVYGIIWKNSVEPGRRRLTIWRMRTACWLPKATDTHSECVILIAFPLQQWLRERASMLRYTYIVLYLHEATLPPIFFAHGSFAAVLHFMAKGRAKAKRKGTYKLLKKITVLLFKVGTTNTETCRCVDHRFLR
jgi:hypothetical protein